MNSRRRTIAVVLAALLAGLCFGPVFGVFALLLPVGMVCLVAYAVAELCRRWAALLPWRPILVAAAGLLLVIETVLPATTLTGLPTAGSVRSLGHGLTSWQLTLESTWPARPDPDLVVFIPLLVLLACLLGLELLDRTPPLVAVVPGLVVAGVSQLYIALTGMMAVLVAVGYGGIVAALLVSERASRRDQPRRAGSVTPLVAAAVVTVVTVVGGLVVSAVDPAGRTPYTLQQAQSAVAPAGRLTSPLDELASRLSRQNRDTVVFRYQSPYPVSRWRQVALDDFDGANWTTSHPFLRLGSELTPGADVRVPTTSQQASVELKGLTGPWLPGQLLPSSVSGAVEPQVDPVGGSLLAAEPPDKYKLTWSKPTVDAKLLIQAGVNTDAPGSIGDLGAVPNEIAALADQVLAGRRATFQTALALEQYMRKRYLLASAEPLPTGHSWPQLRRFLLDPHGVGTSEQFAAGYVALARLKGIPARLVVGFRAPATPGPDGWYTVRNGDALAWPEVAVDGVGWWPLDPAGLAEQDKAVVRGSDADVTDQARAELPTPNKIEDPALPPPTPEPRADRAWSGIGLPVVWVFLVSAALLLLWLAGVPLLKFARAYRRRRRTGSAAVVGAWAEARDRLRAHGVAVTAGMTVRDLLAASANVTDARAQAGLRTVARTVDQALWSGAPVNGDIGREAWAGVRDVRRGLRSRPWTDRLHAALEVRSLF